MPLMSLKQAAAELGYESPKSILRLERRGVLKIIRIPGAARATLRVDSGDVARVKAGTATVNVTTKLRGLRMQHRMQSQVKLLKQSRKIRHYA